MPQFAATGVLLDIEGTTSSISFVYDVMFPYVRRELDAWLARCWRTPQCRAACDRIARDAGYDSLAVWAGGGTNELGQQTLVRGEVLRLMDGDSKATGLKELQGLIWQTGFESGELQAHVFDDVPPALLRWNGNGIDVRIYSSGSIAAQKLFFGHTQFGNLLKQFKGHYDTTTGPKREASSYTKIAAAFGLPPAEIVFLSDVPLELDAARTAGMQTCLCLRPGNQEVSPDQPHAQASSFTQLELV